jgi:hypothetical protein
MANPSPASFLRRAASAASLAVALTSGGASAQGARLSVSHFGAPIGGEVTVKMTSLPPGRALDVGFGGLGSNQELLGSTITNLAGEFSLTLKIPTWASPGRAYFFFYQFPDQAPAAFSSPFIVTYGDGSFRITGTVSSVTEGCAFLTSQTLDKAVYTLVGPITPLTAGATVVVDGTIAASESLGPDGSPCRRGSAIPVQVRSVSAP